MKSKVPDSRVKMLFKLALKTQKNAYAPYSNYKVGCALVDEKGRIFVGANVESVSYTPTICAERTAISTMAAQGGRQVKLIVVVTKNSWPVLPCGVCRQMLLELGNGAEVWSFNQKGTKWISTTALALMPFPYGKEDLHEK